MRVIEQPIVSGAANNEVRKPAGPVAYSCGWLTAADVRLRWQDTSGRLDCNYSRLAQGQTFGDEDLDRDRDGPPITHELS